MFDLFEAVKFGVENGASDIHLAAGNRPAVRIDSRMHFVDDTPITNDEMVNFIRLYFGSDIYESYIKELDVDTSAEFEGYGRFRVNVFRQKAGASVVMRTIKDRTPELSELHLPESIEKILHMREGLVLVTGPTGCGKSTTLASIINEYNKNRELHIITIEDPVEYVHHPIKSVINQRDIGQDSFSYGRALKAALREDPDIILVGEMRDLESISIALTAAETGHLVLSTLHTIGAAKTIDRMVDTFPPEQQQQVKSQLSMTLKAVISQRLLPRAAGKGRIGAFEVMFVNSAIANLIREGKTTNINQMIQTGMGDGMMLMDRCVADLLTKGEITPAAAAEFGVGEQKITLGNKNWR